MYVVAVALFMLILPVVSIAIEIARHGGDAAFVVARWFVFWGVGMRLLIAGIRQIVQPRFTAVTILGLKGEEALVVVRELGFANVTLGTLGVATLLMREWVFAAALSGAIFYGLAGINHLHQQARNTHERIAMVSDLLIAALLAGLCVHAVAY